MRCSDGSRSRVEAGMLIAPPCSIGLEPGSCPKINCLCEWRVVSGQSLDAGRAESTRLRKGENGRKLFRWTLAGRAKVLDDGPDRPESVEVLRLPGMALCIGYPAHQTALPKPFPSLPSEPRAV